MKVRKKRRSKGASLGLVIGIAFALVVIGVGAIMLMKLFGGGEQMQRSTDSGNLTLARAAIDQIAVPLPTSGDEVQFNGVSDHTSGTNGVINLRNFNRVAAQSFLVNLNAYQIVQQGMDNGATGHASRISQAVQSIGSSLNKQMSNPATTFTFFEAVSSQNPTQEYSSKKEAAGGAPTFSYLDRGNASNVYITPQQVPDYDFTTGKSQLYVDKIGGWTTHVSSASDQGANNYLVGYKDGMSPGDSLPATYFVPLRPGARPHLISQANFSAHQDPGSGNNSFNWSKPVPNAISQPTVKQSCVGCVWLFGGFAQMEPIDPNGFAVCMKHGFIRIKNGAPSPTSGFAAGNTQDVFVFTMNDPQSYPTDKNGKPLPYFVGVNDSPLPYGASNPQEYIDAIVKAANNGQTPDCSAFSVGYALNGDQIGLGGVSSTNCQNIAGMGSTTINNITLSNASSGANSDMRAYCNSDPLGYNARPLLEAAYNLQPAQATGSNGESVSVGDIVNLQLLSARAQGQNFSLQAGQYNSGIGYIPPNRGPLSSPSFKIAQQPEGANLASTSPGNQGITKGGKIWNFLTQRMYEIDPNWTSYCPNGLDSILNQAIVPMGGRGYIYFSTKANGGKGGLVLKAENEAIADAPWLQQFIGEVPDAKAPISPTEVKQFQLVADTDPFGTSAYGMIDVDNDWGYQHPYDLVPDVSILNWFSFTPSSGWNNLLGEINLGATNVTGTCPTNGSAYSLRSGASGSDTLTLPSNSPCSGTTTGSGPC